MEIFNLILLLFFAGACVWLIRILLRQKKAIQIYCCFWTASRIMILIAASLCFLPFLAMDLTFLGANLVKIEDGGWVPLCIAGAVFVVAIVGWVYEYYRGYFAR